METAGAFLLVALGGALGSAARFGAQLLITPLFPGFPWAVQLVNVVGSFAIGALFPVIDRFGPGARPFLITGVLGGLTTMSSFAMDVVALTDQKRFGAALLCWAGGAVATLLACAAGYWAALRMAS